MSSATVELPFAITYARVEQAYRRAREMRDAKRYAYAELGLRVARARPARFLKVLDQAAEAMIRAYEDQLGETHRRSSVDFSEKVVPTEAQLWREAYLAAERGQVIPQFQWVYGAAADLAGYW